jgi:hypothetical protein
MWGRWPSDVPNVRGKSHALRWQQPYDIAPYSFIGGWSAASGSRLVPAPHSATRLGLHGRISGNQQLRRVHRGRTSFAQSNRRSWPHAKLHRAIQRRARTNEAAGSGGLRSCHSAVVDGRIAQLNILRRRPLPPRGSAHLAGYPSPAPLRRLCSIFVLNTTARPTPSHLILSHCAARRSLRSVSRAPTTRRAQHRHTIEIQGDSSCRR